MAHQQIVDILHTLVDRVEEMLSEPELEATWPLLRVIFPGADGDIALVVGVEAVSGG